MTENEPIPGRRPSRASVEISLMLSLIGTMVALSFNAGIQYSHISDNTSRLGELESKYTMLHDKENADSSATNVSLMHISTLLGEMQAQQQQLQQSIDKKAR